MRLNSRTDSVTENQRPGCLGVLVTTDDEIEILVYTPKHDLGRVMVSLRALSRIDSLSFSLYAIAVFAVSREEFQLFATPLWQTS
jgi:hypothetical protein